MRGASTGALVSGGNTMVELKLVLNTNDGKSYSKEVSGVQADALLKLSIGNKVDGDSLGLAGSEVEVTGGSDKAGFPMRKGIQFARKRILTGKGVGFSGKDRNAKKQPGLVKRVTVCGERVTTDIRQVNLKVLKAGSQPLGGEEKADKTGEAKAEAKEE